MKAMSITGLELSIPSPANFANC